MGVRNEPNGNSLTRRETDEDVAQMVECRTEIQPARMSYFAFHAGSRGFESRHPLEQIVRRARALAPVLSPHDLSHWSVAQWVERESVKLRVVGSNPTAPAKGQESSTRALHPRYAPFQTVGRQPQGKGRRGHIEISTGCSAAWLARRFGEPEVVGSNPTTPTPA